LFSVYFYLSIFFIHLFLCKGTKKQVKYKIKIEKSAPNRRQTITRVRCFSAEILLQSYAEEGACTPFVLTLFWAFLLLCPI